MISAWILSPDEDGDLLKRRTVNLPEVEADYLRCVTDNSLNWSSLEFNLF